ncbi:MAG: ATP-dependent DNA helicase RecG [Candidatus Vogelbacteria bacterium]|nr:ATP-dependent DNA helicase RecG [Candidatus Vogelbacteria bacterium]
MRPDDHIEKIFRLSPQQKAGLRTLGLVTLRDLLFHLPARYTDETRIISIGEARQGEMVTVCGTVVKNEPRKSFRSRVPMAEAVIEDAAGERMKVVWFNQAYMAKLAPVGMTVLLTGAVAMRDKTKQLSNPTVVQTGGDGAVSPVGLFTTDRCIIYPIYHERRGLTSSWFYHRIQKVLGSGFIRELKDPIPTDILTRYNLPALQTALIWAHGPQKQTHAESARKRFSFEEIFFIQLARQRDKRLYQSHKSFAVKKDSRRAEDFLSRFPFEITKAQKRSIETILEDIGKDRPMCRLLEGDVGSGKTAVAATIAHAIVASEKKPGAWLQIAYMAPTEILARQHFASFTSYFHHLGIPVGLFTGSECRKYPSKIDPVNSTHISKKKLIDWVANGEIPIVIGTHALIQKHIRFKNLALAIIDEQHRFGTAQRNSLVRKDSRVPHLLSMTATPIPRTLALTIFGDLDLTLLDDMPKGRKPVTTRVVTPSGRDEVYQRIREELVRGRQAYVICPRIDDPDESREPALNLRSATRELERLREKIFPEFAIGLVHSKLKPKDKEAVMARFTAGELHILVATSVVEVGVNVPNATCIIIEGAERFGLAQLHQLRGRVLRSSHQAYCYLFTDSGNAKTNARLRALVTAKNGFELAELDLTQRGAGELSGRKQWGISDIGMEAIRNLKLVEAARSEASRLLDEDPDLKEHPLQKERISSPSSTAHFE